MGKKYHAIAEDVRKSIGEGKTRPGKRLPSVRELSGKYGCSRNTVVKAFEILKSNHVVYSIPQSGYYPVERLIQNEKPISEIVYFDTGNPAIGNMNTPDLKHCLDRAVDIYRNSSLGEGIIGVPSLKRQLIRYLAEDQIFTREDNVFVNLGILQALSILSRMPFPNGKDVILIEQPAFSHYIDLLRMVGAEVATVDRTEAGIDLNVLKSLFQERRIKFFYTAPRNHSPLGTSLPRPQRESIARLAAKYDVYIVEDDYYADICPEPKYDAVFTYSGHERVIYLRSYSKIIPWLRIGMIVLPEKLAELFKQHIYFSYYHSYFSPSLMSQATLEVYLRSNIYKKHTESITKSIREKQALLREFGKTLEDFGASLTGGTSGCYSYLQLPGYLNERAAVEQLRNKNVLVSPGEKYSWDRASAKKGFRVSIARATPEEMCRGFEIIRSLIEKKCKA